MVKSSMFFFFQLLLLYDSGGDAQFDNCTTGRTDWIGNSVCDVIDINNNIEECGYDGGDCCECTCTDQLLCGGNGYSCIDPNSGCLDPKAIQFANCTGDIRNIADGKCDSDLNNVNCGYDEGDCCECTCTDGSSYLCDDSHFLCLDPASGCVDLIVTEYASCTGDLAEFANGYCQSFNNNKDCGYDGGDCCECTCIDGPENACSKDNSFDCVDPNATNALYNCDDPPEYVFPCAADLPRHWSVENTTGAISMAEAVNCSGGSFDIEWRGDIVMKNTIYAIDGTVLRITGMGSSATIIGGGTNRLFTVVNASLNLTNLMVSNGSAISGGAIAASGSILAIDQTEFVGNTARIYGGALIVSDGSSFFGRQAVFFNNTGGSGGALFLTGDSTALWEGETTFSGNTATRCGAISVSDRSDTFWAGATRFFNNTATSHGGALRVTDRSSAVWSGEMSFIKNSVEGFGGTIFVSDKSKVSWFGPTKFLNNIASLAGGALLVTESSNISWSGSTVFSNNSAALGGGALFAYNSSDVFWSGETSFTNNIAPEAEGGAVGVLDSSVSWSGDTSFFANIAATEGGAIFVLGSSISWSARTTFSHNDADEGGAIFVSGDSSVSWTGDTTFLFNSARSNGGVVGSESPGSVSSSTLLMNGTTIFAYNTCGTNGGGLAILGLLLVRFEVTNVTFIGNSAGASGGAIFISNTGIGPLIKGANFIGNTAQVGGGVYATGSGITVTDATRSGITVTEKEDLFNPITFKGCYFIDNVADTSGGALNSQLGSEHFINTSFVGNQAGVGGALQLAGTASLDNCSFEDNASRVGGGSALYNIGSISAIRKTSFVHNALNCDQGTFLTFTKSSDVFEKICVGCPNVCEECHLDERVPTCVALSEAGVEHAYSLGGVITVEGLVIHEGYWRATETSINVLECYNKRACIGGIGPGNCSRGYEGPYCSICSKNYTRSLGLMCKECSSTTINIIVAVAIIVACATVGFAVVLHLLHGSMEDTRRDFVDRIARIVPLQAVKIVIVAWQILTQFASVTSTIFPSVYQRFLDGVDLLNFDFGWILATGCIVDIDFHDRMLISTFGPVVIMVVVWMTYKAGVNRSQGSEDALQRVRQKHMSVVILVTFLVYSSVSSVVFKMFDCEHLDDNKLYLRADYTILCDSTKHRVLQVYAGVMVVVYPLGIPALYLWLLLRNRSALEDKNRRVNDINVQSISTLWRPYKPLRFYYEVIECARRILLTGVALLAKDDAAAKIAAALMIAVVFLVVVEVLAPYESQLDAWISRAGHAVVYMSMYFALLLKVDVSTEQQVSQRAFETILVITHVGMISAVLIETMFTAFSSLRPADQHESNLKFRWWNKRIPPVDVFELELTVR